MGRSFPSTFRMNAMYITVGTAKTHVARLLTKVGARDRVQLRSRPDLVRPGPPRARPALRAARTTHRSDTQPRFRGRTEKIGERFKSPLGHQMIMIDQHYVCIVSPLAALDGG